MNWNVAAVFSLRSKTQSEFCLAISSFKEWGILCSQKDQGEFYWEWGKLESWVRTLSIGLRVCNFDGCVLCPFYFLKRKKKLVCSFYCLGKLCVNSTILASEMFEAIALVLAYGCSLYWLPRENSSILLSVEKFIEVNV